jgi:hypothetical protein
MLGMFRKFLVSGIIFSLFFAGCGQLDTMFSLSGTYKVTAKAGQYTLDECSIVKADTPIQPYFIEPVDDDPDIRGLTIFLQSLDGEIISKKLMYTTDPGKGTPSAGSGVTDSGTSIGLPADSGEKTGSGTDKTTGSSSMTGGDLSTGTNDSSDSSADGVSSTTEETGEYADVYRFRESKTIIEPSIRYNEDAIYVKKLSGDLPPLLLPEELEAGQYILVFQVLGDEGILYRVDKPVYYIADSEFTLDDIHIYLPGLFGGSHIVPPEVPIMLETNLAAGTDLEPYLVWYNGKKRVHEGYAADGAARFLWQAPAQTGFHVLKVEAFPFKPRNTVTPAPIGRIKESSLPVSTKNDSRVLYTVPAELETGFSKKYLGVTRWYQFFANLDDSAGTGGSKNTLTAVNHVPEWLPQGNIFGVAIGPSHHFTIPEPLFIPPARGDIEGRLLFRFVPLADGTIFSGSFKLENSLETLELNLSRDREMLILNYSVGNVSDEKTVPLVIGQNEELITAVVSFSVTKGRLSVSLALDTPAQFLPGESIPLPGALTGYGIFQIGAEVTLGKNDFIVPQGRTVTEAGIAGNTGNAQTGFNQTSATKTTTVATAVTTEVTAADSFGAEASQAFASGAKDAVSIIAILDEIILTVTMDVPANANIQTAASVETSSFAAVSEETVENEKPDTETTQAELTPEPAVLKQSQAQPATRTTPVSDRNRVSSKPQAAVEIQLPDRSRVSVSAETPAVSVPLVEDVEQGESNAARRRTETDAVFPAGIPDDVSADDTKTDSSAETVDKSGAAVPLASEVTHRTGTTVSR